MKLPETENAYHIFAFKKGYRLAMEGKPKTHMPSSIRRDPILRQYFQMGWEQLQEDASGNETEDPKTPLRTRFAWYLMMLLAGIGTAALMINQMNERQSEQQQRIQQGHTATAATAQSNDALLNDKTTRPGDSPKSPSQSPDKMPTAGNQNDATLRLIEPEAASASPTSPPPTDTTQAQTPPNKPLNPPDPATSEQALSLLTAEARQDLTETLAEKTNASAATSTQQQPIVNDSPIQIKRAILAENIEKMAPVGWLENTVPKYVRKVYFYTLVEGAEGKTLYHRWIYRQQIMATIPLNIRSASFRTWSSKRMSSAWTGDWQVEVLDPDQNVIFRHTFIYSKQDES